MVQAALDTLPFAHVVVEGEHRLPAPGYIAAVKDSGVGKPRRVGPKEYATTPLRSTDHLWVLQPSLIGGLPAPAPWQFVQDEFREATGTGIIRINRPEVLNAANPQVLQELKEAFLKLRANGRVKKIVLTGAGTTFMSGADLKFSATLTTPAQKQEWLALGQGLANLIEAVDREKPVIAALNGGAYGGGLEMALAAGIRASVKQASVGLTEGKIGLIPGFGGTQRLPRKTRRVWDGVRMIVNAEVVGAEQARQFGIIDVVVEDQAALEAWLATVTDEGLDALRRQQPQRSESEYSAELARVFADANIRTLRNGQAPASARLKIPAEFPQQDAAVVMAHQLTVAQIALTAIDEGTYGFTAGLEGERTLNPEITFTDGTQQRLQVFGDKARGVKALPTFTLLPSEPTGTILVLGTGIMGHGIAQVAAMHGWTVKFMDVDVATAEKGKAAIIKTLNEQFVKKGKLTEAQRDAVIARLHVVTETDDLTPVELVIEAVKEDLGVKAGALKKLLPRLSATCLIATNTSSLRVTNIGEAIGQGSRTVGMHFFNPPGVMRGVEVVAGDHSDPAAVARVAAIAGGWSKESGVVKDVVGFVFNQTARPYYLEALRILEAGFATAEQIDETMTKLGGWKQGPLDLIDTVGLDTNLTTTREVFAAYGHPLLRPVRVQEDLVAAGSLGKKTGRGIYIWEKGVKAGAAVKVEPRALALSVEQHAAILEFVAKAMGKTPADVSATTSELQRYIFARILLGLLIWSQDVARREVAEPATIDTIMKGGGNYPKGLFEWAKQIGEEPIARLQQAFSVSTPEQILEGLLETARQVHQTGDVVRKRELVLRYLDQLPKLTNTLSGTITRTITTQAVPVATYREAWTTIASVFAVETLGMEQRQEFLFAVSPISASTRSALLTSLHQAIPVTNAEQLTPAPASAPASYTDKLNAQQGTSPTPAGRQLLKSGTLGDTLPSLLIPPVFAEQVQSPRVIVFYSSALTARHTPVLIREAIDTTQRIYGDSQPLVFAVVVEGASTSQQAQAVKEKLLPILAKMAPVAAHEIVFVPDGDVRLVLGTLEGAIRNSRVASVVGPEDWVAKVKRHAPNVEAVAFDHEQPASAGRAIATAVGAAVTAEQRPLPPETLVRLKAVRDGDLLKIEPPDVATEATEEDRQYRQRVERSRQEALKAV